MPVRNDGWENADTCAQQRLRVHQIAPKDWANAIDLARKIPLPWYRSQSMSAIAAHVPEDRVRDVIRQAVSAADSDGDSYRRTAVLAWAIDAACARGDRRLASEVLEQALGQIPRVEPLRSRCEALVQLLRSAAGLGGSELERVLTPLIETTIQLSGTSQLGWARTYLNRALAVVGEGHSDLAGRIGGARKQIGLARRRE